MMETPEVEPPSESSAQFKSRPSRTGIDWEALEAAQAARSTPLPADATEKEIAARNAEVDVRNQLPGRMVPYMDRWNGQKWVVWKERYITDYDLAAFSKKPTSASVSTRAGRSELRPGPTPLGSIPKDDKKTENPPDLGSIPKKLASPVIPVSKGRKLNLSPSRGKQESWTVTADEKNTFRIRLTESGYAVVLRWTETDGKRPERYCCYLSKSEWAKAKRGSLESLAALIGQKVEQRIASGDGDGQKLTQVLSRIQSLM